MKTTGAFPNHSERPLRSSSPDTRRTGFRVPEAFTIVEVAMAVIVLALALTTAITVLQRSFLQLDTARNLEIAANIMQCEMEKERLFTWTKLNDGAYVPTIDTSFSRNPTISGRFTLSRNLTLLPSHSNQVAQITLTVQWRAYDGRTLSRSYTTYYTQAGLYAYFYSH